MRKDKIYLLTFVVILVLIMFFSLLLFKTGMTNKIKGEINKLNASVVKSKVPNSYPIIKNVFNSSGENLVNTDVAITIEAESTYNITTLEYSYDLKNWVVAKDNLNSKKINSKIVFNKNMNKSVYVRVVNEKGYKSYAYKTFVNIDKEKPVINAHNNKVKANDNYNLSYIQYSNDLLTWNNFSIKEKSINLELSPNYKYVRAVDKAGNISNYIRINKE